MIKDTSAQDVSLEAPLNKTKIVISAIVLLLIVVFAAQAFIGGAAVSRSIERASVQIARVEMGDLVRDLSLIHI